ncbi:type I restriction endonuclease subunit R [Pseudomonas savastanoi]|uniref:Type I restriction enzyme endonuclease subunit n=1 Tax=Pseudomonas savastanoi pv. glycinea TaxID=318 RepID=A0AB74AZM1_PSESG|nr:type I restriction endonuclease subunit R [Pseudomonas savastanoi]EFW82708.1 type I restriction-modification enzyme, R subunit, putative [Pseudomonas savastanoi pv. glycinea str. B076]KPC26820.1 Type I restriction-modification enzyme [Pseudomonas savastanoi pv. glycinea]KPC37423.1 Type I restriction-modification enzyme [Pseudomonas savastanoi pv. glycinea]KPC45427.1 Type I restriction-modification enzyme [Pseudomonas savastanoi pv. glycinea]KPC47452.1 Type I restriction-modification enzyme 
MTEDQLEQETLSWLAEVGYTHLYGPDVAYDGESPERDNYRQVILVERLRSAIAKLNPKVPVSAREDALKQVLELGLPVQLSANRLFHRLLVSGVSVQYQNDGETRGDFVRLIDWIEVKANDWLAIDQFSIQGPKHTRRPDIILFVNGLPLVLLELKNPADIKADLGKAFDQIQTYKEQIPDLFQYNEILVIADGSEARMGSLSSDAERFMNWRTINGQDLDPLGQFNELETMVRGALAPNMLLDYLRYFVLFEDDGRLVKKIAGYHQFHAVNAAIRQVVSASRPGGTHKGGVVWHTQGSGKSITMTCFAARVMREEAMENPTIVVITDRNDLDGQLFGVFSLSQDLLREQPIQVESRGDLRSKLANRPSGGIVFATIQKFMPGGDEDIFPVLSNRSNIVVIADEAHRTQYGFSAELKTSGELSTGESQTRYQIGYAQHLRDALPNATFVAFTGTPVSTEDRDTRSVFGEYIHVYDMQQATEDGATVAIYYESRLAKLSLKDNELPAIDDQVDELAEDEEDDQQSRLKSRWAALEKVVGAEPRVHSVAADLVKHFEERNQDIVSVGQTPGKAMMVAMSREICVHLYNEIVALSPDWHDDDPEKGAIKVIMTGNASDKALLRPHIYSGQIKKRLEKRFKDPLDPLKLVIVRDMWLTGFDAPCVHTLYVDKPMKGHNLMQAIARVNRVFKDKQGGLVVDYIGIANELKAALKEYTGSKGKGRLTVDVYEAYSVLEEKLDVLRSLLHGFNCRDFLTGGHKLLAGAANHVLGLEDGKKRFADNALAMNKAFTLCCTLDEAKAVREEVAFFQAIKVVLIKREVGQQKKTDEERELAIRQIIGNAVVSGEVLDIFDAVGLDKPNIGMLDDAFLAEVRNLPEKNLAVELLERLLEGEIKSRYSTNLAQEKKFSELLANVIKRYQNRSIETAQVIEELIEMAKKFAAASQRGYALGLNDDELAFYDALASNEASVRELGDEILAKIAHELTASLRANISVDWSSRESVRARLRILVRRILRKYKYPPDQAEEAAQLILNQAETLCETWL